MFLIFLKKKYFELYPHPGAEFKSVLILTSLCKTIHFSKVCWFIHRSPNPLFYRCKCSWRLQTTLLFYKNREGRAATEPTWRLPSSPIVRKNQKDFLCKFKSVLIYMRIAKTYILPLQMFVPITNNTTFSQNSRNNEGNWATLAAPVVAYSEKTT